MKERKATSIDIAYAAGVSQSTVSRALSGSPLVSEETRQKIFEVAKRLKYKVDKNASSLRTQSSKTLALLIFEDATSDESLINPFFLSLLGSITRATARRGYDLLVSFQQLSDDWYADYEEAHRADGLILLGYGDYISAQTKLKALDQAGAHFVLWGPVIPNQPGASIGCDNTHGAWLATRHLLDSGRRRIAFVGFTSDHFPEFNERYHGYLKALQENGIEAEDRWVVDADNNESDGVAAACILLEQAGDIDGIVCASDLIAIGVINALQHRQVKVPQDISVTGFDDISAAAYFTPSLTTIRQDTRQAGDQLVDKLLQSLRGEPITSELMTPRLVVRESCGASAPQE